MLTIVKWYGNNENGSNDISNIETFLLTPCMVSNEVNCYKFPGKNGLDGITDPTSIKGEQPSWIDVIFTDTPRRVCDSLNFVTGLIDFYHIVLASSKMYVPIYLPKIYTFWRVCFSRRHASISFHHAKVFDDTSDYYFLLEWNVCGRPKPPCPD